MLQPDAATPQQSRSDAPAPNPYDAVTYPGHAFPQTHPSHLATIAHLHGLETAPLARMRVLELGCGSGGNLLPMAFQYPGAHFIGIDLSQRAIEKARRSVGELGLTNIVFEQRDIMSIAAGFGQFDYIIAHGVYSWVPQPVRDRMMAIFGELLTPQGVAYVSFNALPGGRMRDLARDVMLFATRAITDPEERVRVARDTLRSFANASDPASFYGAALRRRSAEVDELSDAVFYHDDLNALARSFTLQEVVEAAQHCGLKFVADTALLTRFDGATSAGRQLLAQMPADDPFEQEQAFDLLVGRFFREIVLCRAEIPLRLDLAPAALAPVYVAADISSVPVPNGETRPGVERFSFGKGALSVDLPSAKAALRALGEAWPAGIAYGDLVTRSLREAGVAIDDEHESARLNEALIAILKSGLFDFRLEQPPHLACHISVRPVANALTRWQAKTTPEVTDLRHRAVLLDPVVRIFVCLLDGSRTTAMLLNDLNRYFADEHASGRAPPNLPKATNEQELLMHLDDVKRLAILSG